MSNYGKDVSVGQVWARRDGRRYRLTDSRDFRNSTEFRMEPLDGGRVSWKTAIGISWDMTRVEQ